MAVSSIVFPEIASGSPGFNRYDNIPTVKILKERYLHGVNFQDDHGEELKNSAFQYYIKQAISFLEHQLEITIVPTEYTEEHDYRSEEYEAWSFIQLRRKPVISVSSVEFRLNTEGTFVEVPTSWIRMQNHPGQLQIVPTSGGLSSINIGNTTFLPRTTIFNTEWPSFFKVTYTAGFERNKIPALITHVIGMKAAVQALNIAGELILGAGIASQSLGIDGLSQSVGSTAPASYSGYGARIELYEDDIKKAMEVLKKYYGKGVKIVVV